MNKDDSTWPQRGRVDLQTMSATSTVHGSAIPTLQVWERLTVLVGQGASQGIYAARVENLINGGIVITQPELLQGETLLREQMPVAVQITRQDAIYEFLSQVHRLVHDGASRVVLTPPKSMRRVQRRLFVRIELRRPMKYALLGAAFSADGEGFAPSWTVSQLVDLSAGGLLMEIADELLPNTILMVQSAAFADLGLPTELLATVQRLDRNKSKSLAGVRFILTEDIDKQLAGYPIERIPSNAMQYDRATQNKVVGHIFQQQIKLRQKGLL